MSTASGRYLPLLVGLVGCLVSGTTLMGQLERGLNRIYGVEQDRPTRTKYGLAFLLALGSGTSIASAFVAVLLGHSIGDAIRNDVLSRVWDVAHWPVALALVAGSVALLFRWAPRRRQPSWSWLAYGSSVAVVLWFVVTLALGLGFRLSSTFGDTYGALAGIVALQMWALLSSSVLLFGGAVAAQLEAVRAGRSAPQDAERVAATEPRRPGPGRSGQTPSLRARSTRTAGTIASSRPTGNSSCITSTRKFARESAVNRSLTVRLGTWP